jgi:ABC-type nitrate/sulfonate/bicarbonate transport system substrate-binding protein
MNGRIIKRTSIVRLLFCCLATCALLISTDGRAQERERLRVSTLFIGSSLLPLWVAQDQGTFTRAGLDVQLIWMQSGLSTSALLAGEVDAIFGTPQVTLTVLAAKNPPPLVAIAAWGSASEHWLVVDSSIRSVKELENKTLATSRPKSADHGYIIAILERFGVDPRRVTFLSAGGQGGRLAAVQSGRATGSVFNRYYTIRLKKDGFRDIAKLERPDYPFPPSVLFVHKEALQTKRKALKSFLVAMMEATERQKRDKELGLRLIRKNLRLNDPEVVEAAYQDGVTLSYPFFTERQFQVSLDLMSKGLGQAVDLAYKQVVDSALVEEVMRSVAAKPG